MNPSTFHACCNTFFMFIAAVKPKLIFTNRYVIREMNVNGTNSRPLVANLTNAVGLDYDIAENCIYWSDVTHISSSIKKMCNNSKPVVGGDSCTVNHFRMWQFVCYEIIFITIVKYLWDILLRIILIWSGYCLLCIIISLSFVLKGMSLVFMD